MTEHPCPHCGTPLPEGASFCPHCAKEVAEHKPARKAIPLRRKILVTLLVLVVAAAGLVGWRMADQPDVYDGQGGVTYGDYQLVLGYPDAYFEEVKQSAAVAQSVVDTVDRESRVFYVYQGDNGEHWFGQSYNLLPVMLDPSGVVNEEKGWSGGSGGTFGLAELANGDPYYHPYTPAQLSSYLAESGCGYMLVEHCDDIFVQSYAEMFTDGLAAAADGPALYAVEITDSGAVMTPVEMEGAA